MVSKKIIGNNGSNRNNKIMIISNNLIPYAMILPLIIYVTIFVFSPMLKALINSFYESKTLIPKPEDFVGFKNYIKLFSDPYTLNTLFITFIYVISTVVFSILLGIISALLLNGKFKGRSIVRAAITIPWGTPLIAASIIWYWIFDPQYGVLNFFLKVLGLINNNIEWLINPNTAIIAVVLVDVWRIFPFGTIVILTALQSVDASLFDSAKIDGASSFRIFRSIIIPWIMPTLNVLILLFTIWGMKRFDTIWVMTQGGPLNSTEVLSVRIYREAFKFYNIGIASAISIIGIIISIIVSLFYVKAEKNEA